jgi:hypothetical protein
MAAPLSYDEINSLGRRLAGDKSQYSDASADSLTSLNLLKGIFAPGDRELTQISAIQKNEAKYLLAGIAALQGPRGGQLQEMFGAADFKTASMLGDLIKQRESQKIYDATLNSCLDPTMRTRLGMDQTVARATNLNTFIQQL